LGFGRGSQVSDDITEGIVTTLPTPEARPHNCMNITCADPDCVGKVYCGPNKSEVAINTENTGKIPVIFRFLFVSEISLFFQYSWI
jgi:hypothetical protein